MKKYKKEALTPEQKKKRAELKESRRIERERQAYIVSYHDALNDKSISPFKIVGDTMFIQRFDIIPIKEQWKKQMCNEVDKTTIEHLCDYNNGQFYFDMRGDNPFFKVLHIFLDNQVNLYSIVKNIKIVDNLGE